MSGVFNSVLYLEIKATNYRTAQAGTVGQYQPFSFNFCREIVLAFQPQRKHFGKTIFSTNRNMRESFPFAFFTFPCYFQFTMQKAYTGSAVITGVGGEVFVKGACGLLTDGRDIDGKNVLGHDAGIIQEIGLAQFHAVDVLQVGVVLDTTAGRQENDDEAKG